MSLEELSSYITNDMKKFFTLRTRAHLYLVNKWSNKISSLNHAQIDNNLLNKERDDHDQYKWIDPEYSPYVLITWSYEQKRLNQDFKLPENIKEELHKATFHHIKNHAHHPEFWSDDVTIDFLNKCDRDTPNAGKLVDGTKMPLTYIAAMVADWLAMSEELNDCPYGWADKNVNIRWSFTEEQTQLIYRLIEAVWHKPKRVS